MSATTELPHTPMDLPLPRPAPPHGRGVGGIFSGLRRTVSGSSIAIPDSVSEGALKRRKSLRRITQKLRDVDPSLPARASSVVGFGGMLIREIRDSLPGQNQQQERLDHEEGVRSVPPSLQPHAETAGTVAGPPRTEAELLSSWRTTGEVVPPASAEALAGDALFQLSKRLASVVPMKGMNKPVENMLVSNHKNLTNRWMELSRIASGVKKHNAYLEALRERSRDYATILQSSSQSAINMRSRVRGVLSAIEGLEAALTTRDTARVSAYLRLLNEVLASGARDSEVIAQRQELLMKSLLNDAELIAKGAKQAHTKSSLFAVTAVGALAAGVVLTGGAGLLVSGTIATLTAIAGGGMLTGITMGALLDASDAHEKIERGMQEMYTVSKHAGSLIEGDVRLWRSIEQASRLAELQAACVPSVFNSEQWALIEPQILSSLKEARVGFNQLLHALDVYVVYLFDSGYSLPGFDLSTMMDPATINAARRELLATNTTITPTLTQTSQTSPSQQL